MSGMSPISFHSFSSKYSLNSSIHQQHDGTYLASFEAKFLNDFDCCDTEFHTLHDLLQHYEDVHATLSAEPSTIGPNFHHLNRLPHVVTGQQTQVKPLPDHHPVAGHDGLENTAYELPVFDDCDLYLSGHSSFDGFDDEAANTVTTNTLFNLSTMPIQKTAMQNEMLKEHALGL